MAPIQQKGFLITFSSIMALMLFSLFMVLEIKKNEGKIAQAGEKRYQAYLLADELRQSSDDLTRMARTYSVTGDQVFREYFQKILAIRNGEAPRPLGYHNIYWDFVTATGKSPRANEAAQSLKSLMKEAGFTETEFARLRETENKSNELIRLENHAMNAAQGIFEDGTGNYLRGEPDLKLARTLLHNEEYHQAKESIMKPLEKFFQAVDRRTAGEIASYREKQHRLNLVLVIALNLAILMFFISLALGGMSLWRTAALDTGRSRLARRMAASGYLSFARGKKGLEAAMPAHRKELGEQAVRREPGEAKEVMPFLFFIRNLWNDWPLIVLAVVITFLTLGVSWWFLSENKALFYMSIEDELESGLDATHGAVVNWLERTNTDAAIFSKVISQRISQEGLAAMKDNLAHPQHRQLRDLIMGSQLFSDYIVTDLGGRVLSSNNAGLIGKPFAFPEAAVLEQVRLPPRYQVVRFPTEQDNADNMFSRNIVFGTALEDDKGAVFFAISPLAQLSKILRNGYSSNYGEIYLVDGESRFLSEVRWKEKMNEQGRIGSVASFVVGMNIADAGEEAPVSAARVVQGENGRKLGRYRNYLGDWVVGAWRWDNNYGFGIINEFRIGDAFTMFQSYKNQAVLGSGFTAVLILALTLISIWGRSRVVKANEDLQGAVTKIKRHSEKLAQDLLIGQKVQLDMLPDPIQDDGFNLEAFLKPAQSVSGDFYDFSLLKNGKLYFCVGDVSGKGVPAALFMSVTKSSLNKVLDRTDQAQEVIGQVNKELSLNNDSNMFVTLALGILDLKTGHLLITNAGHNLPYIKKKDGELICLEKTQGPLVGTFEDMEYGQQSLQMSAGDLLFFYTDGVTEAQNLREEFYGDERLEVLLRSGEFANAKEMTSAVFRRVTRFMGRAEQFDDITILSMQYTGG